MVEEKKERKTRVVNTNMITLTDLVKYELLGAKVKKVVFTSFSHKFEEEEVFSLLLNLLKVTNFEFEKYEEFKKVIDEIREKTIDDEVKKQEAFVKEQQILLEKKKAIQNKYKSKKVTEK